MKAKTGIPLRQYWRLLARYVRPQARRVALLTVLLFGNIGLQLLNPQIMRRFIDTAQQGGAPQTLLRIALLFIGIALAQQVVAVLATYVSENVGWMATNGLRADLAEHCMRLDMPFHNAHTPGEMIERLDGDVTLLSSFFSQFVIQVLGNALLLAGVLVLLWREDWRVGLALTGFALAASFTLARLRDIAVPHWTAERQASAELFGFLEERFAGSEDIRANGAEAYTLRNFYRLMRELMRRSLRAALMINILLNAMIVLFAVGLAAAMAVSAYRFQAQAISLGTVYLVFAYTMMIEHPLNTLSRQMQELQRAGAGIARIRELLETPCTVIEPTSAATLPAGPLAVEFDSVSFAYDDHPNGHPNGTAAETPARSTVFRDLSFRLRPGAVLGLLGRTGSGKTTIARLLLRLYDPDSGAIRLGDDDAAQDIRQLSLTHLRQRVGIVTQNVQLFHATVRDNLTFFDPCVSDQRLMQVIDELGLGEWLQSLPNGLDTVLESGGGGLSAGEAQLLAFTRIFLQDPGLVILDEASSRLDPATERLIERAVRRLTRERTAVIIAHRLGTVQRADEIMILEGGQIDEHGPRAALVADPHSRFASLLQAGLEEMLV